MGIRWMLLPQGGHARPLAGSKVGGGAIKALVGQGELALSRELRIKYWSRKLQDDGVVKTPLPCDRDVSITGFSTLKSWGSLVFADCLLVPSGQ